MGRPSKGEVVRVSLRVPKDIDDKFVEIAQKRRIPKTDIYVQACSEFLESSKAPALTAEWMREFLRDNPDVFQDAVRNITVQFGPQGASTGTDHRH